MIRTVARPMLAALFVVNGLEMIRKPAARVRAATPLLNKAIPALGLPDDKTMLVRANGVAMLVGGAMLATGRLPRVASALLAASVVPTTVTEHSFWDKTGPGRSTDRTEFLKDLGLLGGLLLASVDTAGNPSVAWRARQLREDAAARIEQVRESRG